MHQIWTVRTGNAPDAVVLVFAKTDSVHAFTIWYADAGDVRLDIDGVHTTKLRGKRQ